MVIEPIEPLKMRKPRGGPASSAREAVLAAARGGLDVLTLFQPIVSLDDEDVVGYEALSRWPDIPGGSVQDVFTEAAAAGVLDVLDQRCIRAAVAAAVIADLPRRGLLLINTEPVAKIAISANDGWSTSARDNYQVVFELTERSLTAHPGALLAKVAMLRAAGIGIAVDDVGCDRDVLAWLEVIDPDVVKLDLSLIQQHPLPEQARVLTAVYGHHERRGAVIVAEGIETDVHLEQARAVGATLGQGYRFGAPAPDAGVVRARNLAVRFRAPRIEVRAPFDLVSLKAQVRRVARTDLLTVFSRDIQTHAEHATDRPMVLGAVQHAEHVPASARARFQRLATSCSLVAVFGRDLPGDVGAGVRRIELDPQDPLSREWTLVVLGGHTAFALIAQECDGTALVSSEQRFEFVMTTDRTLVAAAAANLLSRIP